MLHWLYFPNVWINFSFPGDSIVSMAAEYLVIFSLVVAYFHVMSSTEAPGPRLNIKTVLSTYGDFHVKDKTAVRTTYL